MIIKSSSVAEALYKKKQENPRISEAALAAYGNTLIKKKGLDFYSGSCDIAEANNVGESSFSEKLTTFNFEVEDLSGKKIPFQFFSKEWGAPCGCSFGFPLLSVNEKEWTILSGNTPVKLKRTPDIDFEEVKLLDKTKRKVVRRWFKPLDNEPEGISSDGTKIYVSLAYDDDPGLFLEISDTGTFRLVPRNTPNIIKTAANIVNFEAKKDDFDALKQFKSKTKSFYLNYYHPCT
ncbi:MAG TPA: hypothetical protein VNB22_03315 [Pyrinomonadaceae bacterium]|nr:hypothetical protein [Pyrinomonadaceae bacterium]